MAIDRPEKNWRLRPLASDIDMQTCQMLAAELQIPIAIIQLLCRRGICRADEVEDFFNPVLHKLPPPSEMKGMDAAVLILAAAVMEKKPIAVFGDYDVDGISATALLVTFFKEMGIEAAYYIPDRFTEGYGLSSRGVNFLSDTFPGVREKGGVLITVDCGISDLEAVAAAGRLGFSVIVTDHHQPLPQLPAAAAIINPLQPGCGFPFKHLAGVGVAFYLLMGLRAHLFQNGFWPAGQKPNLKKYLDLVAIGTVADLVPLTGINRLFVRAGLEVMAAGPRPGLRSLIAAAGLREQKISAEDIAFRLAPRLNAAGRTGRATTAMELLVAPQQQAEQLSAVLDQANETRKGLEQELFDRIFSQAEADYLAGRKSLVLYGNDWHQGVIGIVAARLKEYFNRPTVLLSVANGNAKGSGRSIAGLDIYQALLAGRDLLLRYGGHAMAAGMSININMLEDFRSFFENYVATKLQDDDFVPILWFDGDYELSELLDFRFLKYYSELAPFGAGNTEPIFIIKNVKINNCTVVGEGRHLKFTLNENGTVCQGIAFGYGKTIAELSSSRLSLAFNLRQNSFRGEDKWEINVQDIKSFNH